MLWILEFLGLHVYLDLACLEDFSSPTSHAQWRQQFYLEGPEANDIRQFLLCLCSGCSGHLQKV
jgi:hypothetical protein